MKVGAPTLEDVPDIVGVRLIFYDRDSMESVVRHLHSRAAVASGQPAEDLSVELSGQWPRDFALTMVRTYLRSRVERQTPQPSASPSDSVGEYYSATHARLDYRPPSDEVQVELEDGSLVQCQTIPRRCEIQVVHILDHVKNEVGHNLVYKKRDPRIEVDQVLTTKLEYFVRSADRLDDDLQRLYADAVQSEQT